ncbi:hypothetical protein EVAR_83578_1 [Eumeta japonica]|uniref:Uncharacterized protein n=1 Tax=Eumeta variegata TaxID=151549 RepID=A0A4C1UNN6_EUMVA|nr:hypothetical protein EVAR_83578_1 [Eumeta japonica]
MKYLPHHSRTEDMDTGQHSQAGLDLTGYSVSLFRVERQVGGVSAGGRPAVTARDFLHGGARSTRPPNVCRVLVVGFAFVIQMRSLSCRSALRRMTRGKGRGGGGGGGTKVRSESWTIGSFVDHKVEEIRLYGRSGSSHRLPGYLIAFDVLLNKALKRNPIRLARPRRRTDGTTAFVVQLS